jgi:nitroreductase
MEFSEVVRRRRMVRHYSGRPLSPEVIERVLTSALRAPSAGFSQGWAFLALTDAADRGRCGASSVCPASMTRSAGSRVGHRADDMPPQSPLIQERRRGPADVVHRGHWGRHSSAAVG